MNKASQKQITGNENIIEIYDFRNLVKQFEIPLIYFILKTSTDEDHALSCSAIADRMSAILPHPDKNNCFFNTRTTAHKLDSISLLLKEDDLIDILNICFSMTFGGMIKSREADGIYTGKTINAKGSQKRYYFEPLLTRPDMDLVYGAISSNRYLSETEKTYLLSRLEVLQPLFNSNPENITTRVIPDLKALPPRPVNSQTSAIPGTSSMMLRNTRIIYDAIERKKQIEVIYGSYNIGETDHKLTFKANNEERPYILNPYALMWNDGEYYLVATHDKYENPSHFRVDRILRTRIHLVSDKNDDMKEQPREKIPDSLKKYFKKNKKGRLIFNNIAYATTHPQMIFHQEENLTDMTFECRSRDLQILVDSFGPNISLSVSPNTYEKDSGTEHYINATIHGVQYENAKFYAIAHAHILRLTAPEKLVQEVYERGK